MDDIPWEGVSYYRIPEWEPSSIAAGSVYATASKEFMDDVQARRPDIFFAYLAAILSGLRNGTVVAMPWPKGA